MRLTDIVPAYLIPALMWLGKQDWLDYGLGPGKTTRIAVRRIAVPTKDARLFDGVMKILQQPTGSLVRWNAISKAVAFGPKLLCPTSNQCQAMEHTDLNLPVTEYRQPYPAVFLQLPGDYRTELAQRFGIPCPKYILAFHDLKTGYILTNTFGANPNTEIVAIVSPHPEIQTIEDGLSERVDDGQDIVLADVVTRIALNLCLLMVHFGVEEVAPANAGRKTRLLNASGHKRQSKSNQAKAELAAMPTVIRFKQEVTFGSEKTSNNSATSPSEDGTPKRPHWRRGYFRNQRIGAGRTETKLVFIKPVMINAHHFVGDVKDTQVVYQGKDRE